MGKLTISMTIFQFANCSSLPDGGHSLQVAHGGRDGLREALNLFSADGRWLSTLGYGDISFNGLVTKGKSTNRKA